MSHPDLSAIRERSYLAAQRARQGFYFCGLEPKDAEAYLLALTRDVLALAERVRQVEELWLNAAAKGFARSPSSAAAREEGEAR